jgi:HlyD family secretion protein
VRRTPLVLLFAGVLAVALVNTACSSSNAGISTDAVRRATVTEVVDVPASVTARAVATLTAAADGTLAKLTVAPGATAAKGSVVAVIDSPSARKRLADAQAALAASRRASVGTGSVNLSGLQRRLDAAADDAFASARSAASKVADPAVRAALLAQIDAARKHYDSAAQASRQVLWQVQQGLAGIGEAVAALGAAQQAQAQAAYDLAKSTVDALILHAPFTGVVQFAGPAGSGGGDPLAGLLGAVGGGAAAVNTAGAAGAGAGQSVVGVDDMLSVGDHVAAGSAVVTIVDISEIGLMGEVDETDVLLVAAGVRASVELDAAPGVPYEAVVRTVDLLPTPSARGGVAYRLRLAFTRRDGDAQPPPTPRPGMSAVAHLRVRTAVDAIAVPAAAVFTTEGGGDAVWLLRDGKAVRQAVTVGVQGEDFVQVLSGLDPGQRVVVSGTDKVSAGQGVS